MAMAIKLIYSNISIILDSEPEFNNRVIEWMLTNRMYSENYFCEMNTFVFEDSKSFTATLQKILDEKFNN